MAAVNAHEAFGVHCRVVTYSLLKQTTNEWSVEAGHKLEESDWCVVGKWAGFRWHSDSKMNMEINANDVSLHSVVEDNSPPSSPP